MDLSQYLSELEGQYRLYDVGRRICKIDKQQFKAFENNQIPYPFPYLQHAWLALYVTQTPGQMTDSSMQNETLWFLKWPLDEQGKIMPFVRDDLVHRLIKLSETPLKVDSEIDDPLKDNPFSFNPDDVRRANIHAMVQASQKRPASSHGAAVINYLQAGALNKDTLANWQELGLQGIADVSARLTDYQSNLLACLPFMPAEVYLAFAQCLEHQQLDYKLTEKLTERFKGDLATDNNTIAVEAGMRLLGASDNDQLRLEAWQQWLASDYKQQVACVLAFATRNYQDLAFMPEMISDFLVTLAEMNPDENGQPNFAAFIKIMGDLLFLPGIRNLLLATLRDPERPEILSHALQALLQSKGAQ